jgi:signal peptidase I
MSGTQTQPTVPGDNKAAADVDKAKDTLMQPGKKLVLPTQTGKPQTFKITKVAGDNVEIENPDAAREPGQPDKVTYNKQDIKKSISI